MAYLETLKKEVDLLAVRLPDGVEVARVHWGGGTPTLLNAGAIADLAEHVKACLPIAETLDFSVEIDPNEIDDARLDALTAAGLSRASIGVQDFNPEIQKTIGRIQSYDVTRAAVEGLRARGVTALNADILYGLPDQSVGRISESVQMLLSLSPSRVALYGYAHVPWMARRQAMIPTDALPTPTERLELFDAASQIFEWDGYQAIGIDHFAQPEDGLARAANEGRLRRNFQGYTDDICDVLIGLGASAISRFPQGYAQNAPATAAYQKAVRAGQFATSRGHAFSGNDRLQARIIEMLMCDFAVDLTKLSQEFGIAPGTLYPQFFTVARDYPGLIDLTSDRMVILPKAHALTRMIASRFDEYERHEESHSTAI